MNQGSNSTCSSVFFCLIVDFRQQFAALAIALGCSDLALARKVICSTEQGRIDMLRHFYVAQDVALATVLDKHLPRARPSDVTHDSAIDKSKNIAGTFL